MTFSDGGAVLQTVALTGNQAVYTTSQLSAGTHVLTATYTGDGIHLSSTSAPFYQTQTGCVSPQNACAGTASITGTQPGATPFISSVSAVYGGGTLQSVAYEILPKPGSLTRPLTASYSAQYLTSTGALQDR